MKTQRDAPTKPWVSKYRAKQEQRRPDTLLGQRLREVLKK
jgi:hypothetical protein